MRRPLAAALVVAALAAGYLLTCRYLSGASVWVAVEER